MLLDANILIYAIDERAALHHAAVAVADTAAERENPLQPD
jgi:predicted nucleic acid-binding protein